jgi:hypothetical protein
MQTMNEYVTLIMTRQRVKEAQHQAQQQALAAELQRDNPRRIARWFSFRLPLLRRTETRTPQIAIAKK